MKKLVFLTAVIIGSCAFSATEAELQLLREQISNLTVRVTQLERKRHPLTANAPATKPKKVRRASRLIVTPKVQESMNLLGERFPKHVIKVNALPKFKSTNRKPVIVKPITPTLVSEPKKEEPEVKK